MKFLIITLLLLASLPVYAQTPSQERPHYTLEQLQALQAQQPHPIQPPIFTPTAGNSGTLLPKGCVLFCEGWMFDYGTAPKDFHYFVRDKQAKPPYDKEDWAPTIDTARTIADAKYAKVPK